MKQESDYVLLTALSNALIKKQIGITRKEIIRNAKKANKRDSYAQVIYILSKTGNIHLPDYISEYTL